MTCRYFDRFLLQGVDRNWRQACFFYLAPGLICEGYWQVYSRRSIFRIADPTLIHSIILGGNWPLKPPGSYAYAHGSVQHYNRNSSPSRSCNFLSFVLHCHHDSFPDSSCNFRGFMHNFSPGLSCSCHGFMLRC